MRSKFSEHYRPTQEDFDLLWKEGLFVFDANVLLNLYRYSLKAQEQLVSVHRALGERSWLPHQAAEEFMLRRLDVIHKRRKSYGELRTSLRSALVEVESKVSNLHRDSEVELAEPLDKVRSSFEDLIGHVRDLEDMAPEETNSPEDDEVWSSVEKIFEDRVGEPYTSERIEEIYREGEQRYAKHVPPGYEDGQKDSESSRDGGERRFGDLILWYQALDKAKETQRPVVLITDDRKEDWWWKAHGKTIGPRPELIEEVREKAGVLFYMYRPDRFVEEADRRGLASEGVSPEVIEEIHQLENFEQSSPARKSQVELLSVLATEWWGESGVGILEDRIGKKLNKLSRREADDLIDSLTPSEIFDSVARPTLVVSGEIGYGKLQSDGVPLGHYAERLLYDLESSDFSLQNNAIAALRAAGPQELAELDPITQERLGRLIIAAAQGTSYSGSFGAQKFVEQLRSRSRVRWHWPEAFLRGMLLEALLDEDMRFYPKAQYLASAVEIVLDHEMSYRILAEVSDAVEGSVPLSNPTKRHSDKGAINRYDEVIDILSNVRTTHAASDSPINGLIEAIRFLRDTGASIDPK